ncbi:Esterase/lipase/thioesterase [Heterobasidion irregulare TC 32-1]|uniref:Carboxylic ester hydrolase n=1 Tax=Heterobasidion irregulare (strain TC 32-1) TaxID=747525 RepID=W4K6J3_HETIT|nr:Esterase/lipase/thioesterase [Heterobasidion irregulare TC 32-1]ETW81423.1 Esterase/lipase/thioesterase [Heterobasidion irregulare TC 32-1]
MWSPAILSTILALICSSYASLDVHLAIGTFRGVATANNTERWLGVPFVEPPVGELRFKAPVSISKPLPGIQNASVFGDACPQPPDPTLGAPISENCLHLNIWRPSNTSAVAKLPVLFWIHGGFYMLGASSNPAFDPTRIVQRSVTAGKPIIFVSTNYRLNTFGFLASSNVPGADLNAGLLDQQAALEFVQENIAQFGGDPAKVTLWGQSAGGGSVEAQLLYSSGDLFRAAIMHSSSGPFKTSPPPSTYDEPGKAYANLVNATGCPTGPASLSCLRQLPLDTLTNVSNTMIRATLNNQLWNPTVGPSGTFVPELASTRIASGTFKHIPIIGGSNLNDGSIFSTTLRNLNLTGDAQDDAFDNFVLGQLIDSSRVTSSTLARLRALYPANDSSLGAPFNTGDSLFDRGSAWYGDNSYLSPRRRLLEKAASLQNAWGFFFEEFFPGADPSLGVSHGSELKLLFGPVPAAVEEEFANTYLDLYLNFIHELNPGPSWSKYEPQTRRVLQLKRNNLTMIADDFHSDRTDFLNSDEVLREFIR